MENVAPAPLPAVNGYVVTDKILNNRWFGCEQNRVRRWSFGSRDGRRLAFEFEAFLNPVKRGCFTANGTQWDKHKGRSRGDRTVKSLRLGLELQGLPSDFLNHAPFTVEGKVKVIGNGVPIPMGRAVARAVRRALGLDVAELSA